MSIRASTIGILFTFMQLSACGSSMTPSDACLKEAYDDYKVTRNRHMSDRGSDRVLISTQAKLSWAQASQECQIRHGDPTDPKKLLEWALEVENDETW